MPVSFPPIIQQHLPAASLDVLSFLNFHYPSFAPSETWKWQVKNFVSNLAPTIEDEAKATQLALPPKTVLADLVQLINTQGGHSIICAHLEDHLEMWRYPLWLVQFWAEVSRQQSIQEKWQQAVTNLENMLKAKGQYGEYRKVKTMLSRLPWTGTLRNASTHISMNQLAIYFTTDWLSDDHELAMLDVLMEDLSRAGCSNEYLLKNTAFSLLLKSAFGHQSEYHSSPAFEWLRRRGEDLASGPKKFLVTIVNKENIHWTAVVLDFESEDILYGDSYNNPMPTNL